MNVVPVDALASAINESRAFPIGDQLANLARHFWYHGDTMEYVKAGH
jgi:hypothetical protein